MWNAATPVMAPQPFFGVDEIDHFVEEQQQEGPTRAQRRLQALADRQQELLAGATRAGGAEECPWVLLAYPNRGESWDAERLSWREAEAVADAEFARLAASWRAAHPGQPLAVGGCCRTTPATISAVAAALAYQG